MNNNTKNQNGDEMSGNEPTGAKQRRKTKVAVWLSVAGLCTTGASLVPVGGHTQAAQQDFPSEGMVCTDGDIVGVNRVFNLIASDGYTSEPDGNAIYDWGYGLASSSRGFQLPGPVLCANQGDSIVVNLANSLPVATSIQFPGQDNVVWADASGAPQGAVGPVVDSGGELKALVPEAPASGSVSYSFTATTAGTYRYESGSDPQLQVQMGLFGALVIRPTFHYADDASGVRSPIRISASDILNIPLDGSGTTNGGAGMDTTYAGTVATTAKCAYPSTVDASKCDPLAIYDGAPESENILMLSEIDPGLHTFMEQHQATPGSLNWNSYPSGYKAHYFMINGRSMPDTLAPNNAPWLPSQPYGAMAHVRPWELGANPLDAMLRYVGFGTAGYDFHPHSNHEHVIAQDGSLMKGTTGNDNTEEKFNLMVGSGATVDATFRWTNEVGYADTDQHRVPVAWPNGLNLQEGDFWSGSPYLGESGVLNPGILTKTQCGEYYHVAHNHDLTQVTNYGITFGGMLTLIKVEPPLAAQIALNMDCG